MKELVRKFFKEWRIEMLSDEDLKKIDPIENLKKRPEFDICYLTMAYVMAQRSFDPSSKCGTIIVSKDGRPLAMGYNGPIKGSKDEEIPLTRPERYYHMLHGEENALLSYSSSHQDIEGATAYVTGRPCHRCLRMLIQKGIKRIVYSQNKTKVVDDDDIAAQKIMLYSYKNNAIMMGEPTSRVEMVEVPFEGVEDLLKGTQQYIDYKKKMIGGK